MQGKYFYLKVLEEFTQVAGHSRSEVEDNGIVPVAALVG